METFRTYCSIDLYGRLNVLSSTQIVFHARRIIANALHIPKSMVRVTKPRIGGGFGAKQTAVCEVYPAFVTWKTKKPSKLIFTREESQIASTPRHEMEIHLRLGADRDGTIRGLDLYTLSNTGAYGEHGPTTVGLSGHKSIPLYGRAEAFRFTYDVVYTNHMSAGAYRGYGATQGLFAVESAVNELAAKLHMDPFKIREMNIVHEGDVMPAYYGAVNTSCTLDRCLAKVHEMINWDEKYPRRDMGNGKIRAVGMGMAMQGSGISGMDVGSATLKVNDEGFYTLLIGAADMGTGCDTTLAQIAAEVLECGLDNITVFGADTDTSPYDSGSYASSTTYITGKAVEKCALKLRSQICKLGAQLLDCSENDVEFDGKTVFTSADPSKSVSLGDIATASMFGHDIPLEVTETHMSPLSPPPYMVGAAEVEVDTETGEVKLLEFDACVDCGTPINPNLTRVQAEGGILQGIGMTLTENASMWSLRTATSPTAPLVQSPSVRWSSIRRCPPSRTPSTTPSAPASTSCPSRPKKSQWQWPKQRVRPDDRPRGSAIPRRNGTRYFSGGRRREDNIALCAGPPLFGAGTAGARLHHDPHPASGRELRPR